MNRDIDFARRILQEIEETPFDGGQVDDSLFQVAICPAPPGDFCNGRAVLRLAGNDSYLVPALSPRDPPFELRGIYGNCRVDGPTRRTVSGAGGRLQRCLRRPKVRWALSDAVLSAPTLASDPSRDRPPIMAGGGVSYRCIAPRHETPIGMGFA